MEISRRAHALATLTAASALALTACGGSSSGTDSSSTSSSSSSQSAAPSSESTPAQSDAPSEGSVKATRSGLTFDVPDGWETIDPSALAGDSSKAPDALDEMAKSAGMSPEEFLQNMAQTIDVLVLGEAKDGFAQNINVIANPQPLDEKQLRATLEQQNATVTKTEQVTTAGGTAALATYTMTVGSQTVEGKMLAVPSAEGAGVITVSTLDKRDTDTIMSTVVKSVQAV